MSQAGLINGAGGGGGAAAAIPFTVTTIGAVTNTGYTYSMGTSAKTVVVFIECAAYEPTTPAGAGYEVFGTFRTDGTTCTEIGADSTTFQEDTALAACDVSVAASGNTILIQATGTTGLTVGFSGNAYFTST